jgi:hypothetical protein
MQESLEFATAGADTVSFVLVTPDLFGEERVRRAGRYARHWLPNFYLRLVGFYPFNGVLLAIGAAIFLTSRVLIMYDTWPHSVHAAAVLSHQQAPPGGQSAQPAEQP